MEERGNKTIMCSVLFLDIVEYSKKSVAGQISLKDRFNSYLSEAIRDVPMTDRIILDTGDGAAINFLGDVEDALKAALGLRESLLNEGPDVDQPLLVRMGINLGPVRLVRDINGQPNIVGDGINVAQRVMGFADVAQILVSRSYYDAVSRLSPQYAGMFHYQGSRTDKHVREHEVYAIGYPGDKTTRRAAAMPLVAEPTESTLSGPMQRAKVAWCRATEGLDTLTEVVSRRFRGAETGQRVLYVAAAAVPLLLLIALLTSRTMHAKVPVMPAGVGETAEKTIQPGLAGGPVEATPAGHTVQNKEASTAHSRPVPNKGMKKNVESRNAKAASRDVRNVKPQVKLDGKSKNTDNRAKTTNSNDAGNNSNTTTSSGSKNAYISITCVEGTEVFVDGIRKGRIDKSPLSIAVAPGKHTVIVSNASKGIFTQSVNLISGKTEHLKPSRCN